MTLTLPDDIQMSERDLKQELALSLYAARKLTLIQAAGLAGMAFFEFQKLLRDRQIPQHYGMKELDEDVRTLRKLGVM